MLRYLVTGVTAIAVMASAQAQTITDDALPISEVAIDPATWRSEIAGPPTRILTVGSTHLGQMSPVPNAPMLELLIARLVTFAPDIITHEGVSGEQCEMLNAAPELYDGAATTYCWDAAPMRAITGLTGPQARVRVAATLAAWPVSPTAAQRRSLIVLLLSANDRPSALVQWLQLPEDARAQGDDLTAEMVTVMTGLAARMNETYAVAAVVAARLGHARIFAVDDHSSDGVLGSAPPECEAAIQRLWQSPAAAAAIATWAPFEAAMTTPEGMLHFYRFMNSPETQRLAIDVDHRAAVGSGGAGDCGRRYVAWWETRNLRMVANVRAAMGNRPGARVLNIVGASHKPYYDLYLSRMADAVIVDAAAVLGTD